MMFPYFLHKNGPFWRSIPQFQTNSGEESSSGSSRAAGRILAESSTFADNGGVFGRAKSLRNWFVIYTTCTYLLYTCIYILYIVCIHIICFAHNWLYRYIYIYSYIYNIYIIISIYLYHLNRLLFCGHRPGLWAQLLVRCLAARDLPGRGSHRPPGRHRSRPPGMGKENAFSWSVAYWFMDVYGHKITINQE